MFQTRIIIISTLSLLLSMSCLFGQTTDRPWAISLGGGVISYRQVPGQPDFSFAFYDPSFQVGFSRYLSSAFDLRSQLTASPTARHPGFYESGLSTMMLDMNYMLAFKLNNGVFLKEQSFFAPYVMVGVGGSYVRNHPDTYIPFGLGMRFRLSPKASIRLEMTQKRSLNRDYQNLQYAIAFVYNLGAPAEEVPEIPKEVDEQLLVSSLLPIDTDQDGLIDQDDDCPELAGSIRARGCPSDDPNEELVADSLQTNADPVIALKESAESEPFTQESVVEQQVNPAPPEPTDWNTGLSAEDPYGVDSSKSLIYLEDDIDLTPDGEKSSVSDYYSYAGSRPEGKPSELQITETVEESQEITYPEKEELKYNSNLDAQSAQVMNMPCGSGILDKVGPIFFDYGSDQLDPYVKQKLDDLATVMKSCGNSKLVLEGHTDATGSQDQNLILSVMRAYNVKYYLVYKHGISQTRITSSGLGEKAPIADNNTNAGREKNRRVDFQIMF